MADFDMLTEVKSRLGITTEYQDQLLQGYIDEVKLFMSDAGVDTTVINSIASVGIIARGVSDLWNYGAGETQLSDYFYKRLIQLKNTKIEQE